jgi:diadenosine tetraphosphate (Ap4A) HIT family hydrolase
VRWSDEFYAWRAGDGCPSCAEGRPESTAFGHRYFAGELSDAYLARAGIQRGLSIVVFRGRHVVEPTELTTVEAATYGREVLRVAEAIAAAFGAIMLAVERYRTDEPTAGGPGSLSPPRDPM